ncbi:hypothetical protein AX17_003196 [Amanita inopinata Kibby_2008]|nr:hypothetical protein AX17_003196 [Amanita inopinata Kibby_2008]
MSLVNYDTQMATKNNRIDLKEATGGLALNMQFNTPKKLTGAFAGTLFVFGATFYVAKQYIARKRKAELDEYRAFAVRLLLQPHSTVSSKHSQQPIQHRLSPSIMSHEAKFPHAPPPARFGVTFVVGATLVGAGLVGFWNYLVRHQEKKEKLGTNPHYEQLLAHVGSKDFSRGGRLPTTSADRRSPPTPTTEHNSAHSTIPQVQMAGESNAVRERVPPPQRGKDEDPTKAYTKSPEYVESYGKTPRAQKSNGPS